MFTRYYDKGPLYIIIPKQPKYNGEKYQFHFATNSFMNEKDQSIKGNEKELVERYPQLGQIFSQQIQQTDRGYWMTGGLTPQDRERLVKILKNNTVTMSDGTHVVYLNDANRVENLDITKEHKAAMLLTNGQYGTDDPTDSDLSRNRDGLPILAFALFNKDFTDGVLLFADVNDGEVEYSVPKTGSYNKDMPEDIKPVYDSLSKITKSPYLDNIQTFEKIQYLFVPPNLRMNMFDIKDYLGMDDDY